MIPNISMSAVMEKNLGTQSRVRNSRGKQAIGVRAIEVVLYFDLFLLLVDAADSRYLIFALIKRQ